MAVNSIFTTPDDNRSKESLQALGCDGCPTNIEKHSGIIRTIEVALNRPLQWLVCMLHLNELPLKHIFEHFDGTTSGPVSFTGQIWKVISRLAIVNSYKLPTHRRTCRKATRIYPLRTKYRSISGGGS